MGTKLTMFEEKKHKTIKRVCHGQLSKERAEVNLDLSRRQINRLVKAHKEKVCMPNNLNNHSFFSGLFDII